MMPATISANILKAILLICAGYASFSAGDAVVKYLGSSYDARSTVFYAYGFLLLFLLVFSHYMGGIQTIRHTSQFKRHCVRGMLFAVALLLFFYGLQNVGMAEAYTLLFITPFLSILIAIPYFRERVHLKRWLIVAAGFAGVLIVLRPGLGSPTPAAYGILLAALIFAVVDIMARKLGKDEKLITFAFFPAIFSIITMSIWLAISRDLQLPPLSDLPLFAAVGFCHFLGIMATSRAYTLAPMATVSPFHYTQLVWGVIYGYFLFNELPDQWTMAGAVVIVASGLALIRQETKNGTTD